MIKFEKVSYEQFKKDIMDIEPHLFESEIKEIYDRIELPTRSTKCSAGFDFKTPYQVYLSEEKKNKIYPTGIKCQLDDDKVLLLMPRSSLGMKYGFTLPNTIGVIDADYYNNPTNEGHIKWCAKVDEDMILSIGEKYMQGVIVNYYTTNDDNVNSTRNGGIGSTGK